MITSRLLLQCYASFLRPLVGGMYQHFLATIRLSYLPSSNPLAISIHLLRYSIKYLLLQPRCARCMYYVVHIIAFIRLSLCLIDKHVETHAILSQSIL